MHTLTPPPQHRRVIANWLLVCVLLVALMVAVGGITRLTESGLSIVEWKLVSGTLPPMSARAWQAEFNAYQATPQFLKVNRGFTLGDFKNIYWLEYLHRLLGRVIGMAVLLPLLYFAARRILPAPLLRRGLLIGLLVGAQGAVGWVMVASGLVDQPRVEPLKLAAHLLLAFAVFSLMLWTRWQVLGLERGISTHSGRKPSPLAGEGWMGGRGIDRALTHAPLPNPPRKGEGIPPAAPLYSNNKHSSDIREKSFLPYLARLVLLLLILQIFFGALVAGLRAGLTYNTYPLMDGQFIPDGLHLMHPWWLNHLESPLTVQFQHRMGAIAVVIGAAWFAWRASRIRELRFMGWHLAFAVFTQFCLGVATLLSGVNMWLASAHQLVALGLVASLMRACYTLPLRTRS